MKINKLFLSLPFLLLATATFAQQQSREDVVFNAMRDEAARTKTMRMGQMPPPFLLKYYLEDSRSITIQSQYGSIVTVNINDGSSKIGSEIFIGNSKISSCLDYSGKINTIPATIDNNYLSLRTSLWTISDVLYKNSIKEYQIKASAMQQMTLSNEEKAMADHITLPSVKNSVVVSNVEFNQQKWSSICNKLSAVFKSYPDLTNTSVTYSAVDKTFYIFNPDGIELSQKVCYVNISASATIQDNSGVVLRNNFSIYSTEDSTLPVEAELLKSVEEFATKMSSLKDVQNIKEYYNGPVLFTESAANSILLRNLLGNSGIVSTKALTKTGWIFNPLERRMGKKVIDHRLTVKNLTALKEYKGKSLIGGYGIDDDGVKPAQELTLIENGILKQMLNGTSETTINTVSTGSSRLAISNSGMNKTVLPGILKVSAKDCLKESAMKKQLAKLAKDEGLSYAYIVHSLSESCPEVYRYDIKSGDLLRVGSTNISAIDMASLRRIAAIGSEEIVVNSVMGGVLMSVITPKSIILNDIEIDVNKLNKTAQPILKSPLKR